MIVLLPAFFKLYPNVKFEFKDKKSEFHGIYTGFYESDMSACHLTNDQGRTYIRGVCNGKRCHWLDAKGFESPCSLILGGWVGIVSLSQIPNTVSAVQMCLYRKFLSCKSVH